MTPDQMPAGTIEIENGHVMITTVEPGDPGSVNGEPGSYDGRHYGNIESFEEAELWAAALAKQDKATYLGVDRGSKVHPRFDVCQVPQVGDPVSFAFNGDCYPCGEVARVSASFYMVTTTTGKVFRRRKQTASWALPGGTWSMVAGHIRRTNPHV